MNKWFRLATVSFIGIILSMFGLYFVQFFDGQGSNTNAGTGHSTAVVQTANSHGSGNSGTQGYNQPTYAGFIPGPRFTSGPRFSPGPWFNPGPGYYQSPGFVHGAYGKGYFK